MDMQHQEIWAIQCLYFKLRENKYLSSYFNSCSINKYYSYLLSCLCIFVFFVGDFAEMSPKRSAEALSNVGKHYVTLMSLTETCIR